MHVLAFTGAGISAESGLRTFRDSGGLWENHRVMDVATPEGWARDPGLVLDFYNARRRQMREAEPNAAHRALADLEAHCEVTVVTQNVDDLHERAGSTQVLHLHGRLDQARSVLDEHSLFPVTGDIQLGQCCPRGGQLRPHVVWFGEWVLELEAAAAAIQRADWVLAIGSSLSVYPAAGLLQHAPASAHKRLVALEVDEPPADYIWLREAASSAVPRIVEDILSHAAQN